MFMSLTRTHPIWTSCGSNPFEVHKATVTVKMLAGRYLTDMLQRHWTPNKSGSCLLPACSGNGIPGTLEHLLLDCPSLANKRQALYELAQSICNEHVAIHNVIAHTVLEPKSPINTMQLLLDCTVIPEVIRYSQIFGPMITSRLLYLGRTWCYSIHRERMNLLGLIKYR